MSGYVRVRNDTKQTLTALGWFRHQEWDDEDGDFISEKRDTKDMVSLEPGDGYYENPDTSTIEFVHGRPMSPTDKRFFNAHTHLQVGLTRGNAERDDWEADTEQQTGTTAVKFTDKDNP